MFQLQVFQYVNMTCHVRVLKCLPDDGYLYPKHVATLHYWIYCYVSTERNFSEYNLKFVS